MEARDSGKIRFNEERTMLLCCLVWHAVFGREQLCKFPFDLRDISRLQKN